MGQLHRLLMSLSAECSWSFYAAAFTACAVGYIICTKIQRRKLPPGPFPLPYIGSALGILGRPLHVTFGMLQKKYGDIYCLRVAGAEVVVINSHKKIKEALISQGKKFNGRPDITWTSLTQKHGIFSLDGHVYQKQKGVIMSILTDINWDKMEQAELKIQEAGENLITWLSEHVGKPVNPQIYLDTAICNVTSEPLMGIAFKPTDDLMIAVSKIAMDIFIDAGAQNVNNYFTFLRNSPGDPTNYHVLLKNAVTAMDVVKGVIKSHKEKLEKDPKSPRIDFIDHYLDRIEAGTDPMCTEQQLVAAVTDLFAMGIEASATTLRWALLLIAQRPEVESHIQKEIDEVMHGQTPALKFQKEMHYTNSFIAEVQRYVNLVSINLPHATTEDVTFHGYEIPKGAIVIPNLASIHYDEATYPDAHNFHPDRFVKPDGYHRPIKFLPYSAGTRMCPGKNISQWQLFLMLTTILQRFNIRLSGSVGEDIYGLIRYPGNFHLVFDDRKTSATHNNNSNGIA